MNKSETIRELYKHLKTIATEQCTDVTISQNEILAALGSVGKEVVNNPALEAFHELTSFFEQDNELLIGALDALLNHLECITPERNCCCHLGCPPCGDCVEYSRHRELIATINIALLKIGADKNAAIDDDSGII